MSAEESRASSGHAFPSGFWFARQLGTTEAELLHAYPGLRAEDLSNAWAYYRAFKSEIDTQVEENEAAL